MSREKGRLHGGWLSGTFAALAFVSLVSIAFAGSTPPGTHGNVAPRPAQITTLAPVTTRPVQTIAPRAIASTAPLSCTGVDLKHVAAGVRVPLSCFKIPAKTPRNTVSGHGSRLRPMAASGATIDLTPGTGCGSSGALYSVGCSMGWKATNDSDWSGTDNYTDYYILPNSTTATSVAPAGYAPGSPTAHTLTLSTAGTYAFFVYDNVQQVIISIVYINAGAPFNVYVYQDPYHTQQSYQFDVTNSQYAYIYLPDVSTTDAYVVYVMSTSVNSYCVFLTPSATPAPASPSPRPTGAPGSLVCNPNNATGVSAPSGALSLQWPINTSYQAGTYSIVVYDQTAGQTLGQVQVSLTGIEGYEFQLYATPGPYQSPATFSTPPSTIFAWDSTTEESVGGIIASVPGQLGAAPYNGAYRITASDPDGQIVSIPAVSPSPVPASCTSLNSTAANCTVTGTFSFASANPALSAPGNYPSNTWTMQLYSPINTELEASQYFQIKGYSVLTQFDTSGAIGQTLNYVIGPCCDGSVIFNQATSMIFTNNSNVNYPIAAESLKGIEYTTGPGSTLTASFKPPTNGNGWGSTFTVSGCTGTYNSAAGCSIALTDTAGGTWTATDYCSVTPTAPTDPDGSYCVLQILPTNNSVLVPGASIKVPGMTFYAWAGNSGWLPCYNVPCATVTSILPVDGLSWSNPGLANSPAYTPVYIGASTVAMYATAGAHFIGSNTNPGNSSRNANAVPIPTASPFQQPWINTHFYPAQFVQGEYQNSTPFQAANGRDDILVIDVSDCIAASNPAPNCLGASTNQVGAVEITFPSGINASQITVDPSEPAIPDTGKYYVAATASGGDVCENTPPANAICLNPGGNNYNDTANASFAGEGPTYNSTVANAQAQIWLDVPASQASYIASELSVQVYSTYEQDWFPITADRTASNNYVIGNGNAGTSIDSLSLQGMSLNSNLMATQFNPTTVTPGATTTSYSLDFTNTSTAADANPDPIDAVVIEQATNKNWTLSASSITSGTGSANWTGAASGTGYNPSGGNTLEYWFTLNGCSITPSAANGPPQPPSGPTNPTTAQTQLTGAGTYCTAAEEKSAIAPGDSMTFNFTLANTTTGTQTFYVYAHGANGGGWSAPKVVTVNASTETAAVKFFSWGQGGTDASCKTTSNVAANTVATVSKPPNCLIYEVTNTSSGTTKIGAVNISLPAFDINGLPTSGTDWTLVGSPITQYLQLGTINASGTFVTSGVPAGCAITGATQPVPGSSAGTITVSGCTGFSPNANIAVEFVANTPQIENNSYLVPATIDGAPAGLAWTGSDEIQITFSIGVSVAVDPGNPGPGNSHPIPACSPAQCAFSGTVLDFGQIAAAGTVTGTDVVRATVVYEGATQAATCPAGAGVAANTWQLEMNLAAADPTPPPSGSAELTAEVDTANGTSGLTYATGVGTAYFTPVATPSQTVLSCGQETSGGDYDTIMNFKTAVGTDTSSHFVTVIYTVIAN